MVEYCRPNRLHTMRLEQALIDDDEKPVFLISSSLQYFQLANSPSTEDGKLHYIVRPDAFLFTHTRTFYIDLDSMVF